MRHVAMCAALAACMVLGGPARAAQSCLRPAEQSAMDEGTLKSLMMLTAETCHRQDDYNKVMRRFRPEFAARERTAMGWFGRNGGRARYDAYITELANSQSHTGVVEQGDGFCAQNGGLFSDILALRRTSDLAAFAHDENLVRPIDAAACPVPARASHAATHRRR